MLLKCTKWLGLSDQCGKEIDIPEIFYQSALKDEYIEGLEDYFYLEDVENFSRLEVLCPECIEYLARSDYMSSRWE